MATSDETTAAEMLAELQYLRQRNNELQTQVDKLSNNQLLDFAAEGTTSCSSSLDGGLERVKVLDLPIDYVRSSSIGKDGLHRRRPSAGSSPKSNNKQTRSFSFSPNQQQRGGWLKSKDSDVDLIEQTATFPPPSPPLSPQDRESNFDNEHMIQNTNMNTPKGGKKEKTKNSGNGVSSKRYKPPRFNPLTIEQGDGLELPEVKPRESDEESDTLMINTDESHNKQSISGVFPPFKDQIKERGGWLIGLLFLQSCSSFIIQYNEKFLQDNMVLVQFLTMLVGAGGNAGNQAAVHVIRSLATGKLNRRTMRFFLFQGKPPHMIYNDILFTCAYFIICL